MATCESCGRDGEDVTEVQRIYLLPSEDTEAGVDGAATPTAGDIERWCASCMATFPHLVITED